MSQECDIIITSGGVSMGDKDLVKPILEQEGQVFFGRMNMKPGKPSTFAKLNQALVFALPGNPVSCYVCFHLLVRYAIDTMLNRPDYPVIQVSLGSQELKLDPRPEYHRVIVAWDGAEFKAVTTGNQISSRLMSASKANALLVLPKSTIERTKITGKIDAILIRPFNNLQQDMKVSEITQKSHHNCSHFTQRTEKTKIGVLTVSDRCSQGVSTDTSGPYLIEKSKDLFPNSEVFHEIIPDEIDRIKEILIS